MKALKFVDNEMMCRYEDAIYFDDGTYQLITWENQSNFQIGGKDDIDKLIQKEKDGWTTLTPLLECDHTDIKVIAGETSWGGAAFVGLKRLKKDSFEWIIHLSTMNNPQKIWIEGTDIHVHTDLNYPDETEFIIPIESPEKIRINKSSR